MAAVNLYSAVSVDTTDLSFGENENKVTFSVPTFTPESLQSAMTEIKTNRARYLQDRPVSEIVEVLDRVNRKWLDPEYKLRQQAIEQLPITSGFSEEMIAFTLNGIAGMFTEQQIYNMIITDLGDSRVLDTYIDREGLDGKIRAYGPDIITNIFAGNVPALPIISLTRGLLVKSANLGKVASGEPLFAHLYLESIAEEDKKKKKTIALGYWVGGDEEMERLAFDVPIVVAYGGPQAIQQISKKVGPETRFVPYGHKLGFGVIGKEGLTGEDLLGLSQRAALDASLYDQQGCLSPHIFYVEAGGEVSPEQFAEELAKQMSKLSVDLPRGNLSIKSKASIASIRQNYEMKSLFGGEVKVFTPEEGLDWMVIYDENNKFEPSCTYRVIRVKPVKSVDQVFELMTPFSDYLQTVGVELPDDRLDAFAQEMGKLGATRITPIGRMGMPLAQIPHDGHFGLSDLVRWAVIENGSSANF